MAERSDASPLDAEGKATQTSQLPAQPISLSAVRTIASSVSNLAVSENKQPDTSTSSLGPVFPSSHPHAPSPLLSQPNMSEQDSCCCPPKKKKVSKELSEVFQLDDVGSSTELYPENDPSRSSGKGCQEEQQLGFSGASFQTHLQGNVVVSSDSDELADCAWCDPGERNHIEVFRGLPRPCHKNQAGTSVSDESMPVEHSRQRPVDDRSLLKEVVLTPSPYWYHESSSTNHRNHSQFCEIGDGINDPELGCVGGDSGLGNTNKFIADCMDLPPEAWNTNSTISQCSTEPASSSIDGNRDLVQFQYYAGDTPHYRFSSQGAQRPGRDFSKYSTHLASSTIDFKGDAVHVLSETGGSVTDRTCKSEDGVLKVLSQAWTAGSAISHSSSAMAPGGFGCGEDAMQLEVDIGDSNCKKAGCSQTKLVSADNSSTHVPERTNRTSVSSFRIDFTKLVPSASFDVQICSASTSTSGRPTGADLGCSAKALPSCNRDMSSSHQGLHSSSSESSDFNVNTPSNSAAWSAQVPYMMYQDMSSSHDDTSNLSANVPSTSAAWSLSAQGKNWNMWSACDVPSLHQVFSSSHTDASNLGATLPSCSADWSACLPSLNQGSLTSSTDYETDTSACSESSTDTTSSDSCPSTQSPASSVSSARRPPSPTHSSSSPVHSKTKQARKNHRKLKQKTPRYGLKTDAVGALLGIKRSEYAKVRQIPADCRTKGCSVGLTGKESSADMDQQRKAVGREFLTLDDLPAELLVHIFSFLPPAIRLSGVSLVCKRWQSAVLNPVLWRRLDLRNLPRLRDCHLNQLATLSDRVSSLILSDGGSTLLTDNGVALAVSHCLHLKKVKFNRCFFLSDEAFQSVGFHCHKLVCLNLSGCFTVTDKTLLAVSEGCPQLQDLDVGQCAKITDTSVCAVAKGCPRLTRFRLDQCGKLSNVAVEVVANACRDLQYLHLLSCSLSDAGICHLAKLSRLVVLDVSNVSKLSPRVMDQVTTACPRLETLAVSLNRAVDDVCLLAIVQHCPRLKCLSCVACSLSDVGLRHIASHAKYLERLDVAWCSDITDTGIRELSASCPHLRYLGIMRCGLITMATVEDLLIKYPHIQYSNFELDSRRLLGRAAEEGFRSAAV